MMRALALLSVVGLAVTPDGALAAPPAAPPSAPPSPPPSPSPPSPSPFAPAPAPPAGLAPAADGGFHMEPRAAFDDVFGDSADYRKTIDRFLSLSGAMQHTRDGFARAVQTALAEVQARAADRRKPRKCPEAEVARPYARALKLGSKYLHTGRELTRRFEQLREFDRLGETVGLTPDYRRKVQRAYTEYAGLLTDYREMKVAFHDQLADELKFAGCDLDHLAARANTLGGESPAREEIWPSSGAELASAEDQDPHAAAPPVPAPVPTTDRSGVLFYVDNTRCSGGTHVELDGRPIGEVPGSARTAFQTTPGPHELCLVPTLGDPPRRCGDPGTVRRSYLHEGWTIALRCD